MASKTDQDRPDPLHAAAVKTFGIWGGKPPGAWCRLDKSASPYWGTHDEAEAALAVFLRESHPQCSYTIAAFDPAREPHPQSGHRPSKAQLAALRFVSEYGTWNALICPTRATRESLCRRGWMTLRGWLERPCVLTTGGCAALSRASCKPKRS